jgi:diguanylate cyclase (GGDEF)-like protein
MSRSMRFRVRIPLGVLAVATIAAVVALLTLAPDLSARIALDAWAQVATELAGALACGAAALHTRGRARLVWSLFALAELTWVGTDAALALIEAGGGEVPEVGWLDVGWLSYYLAAGLATLLLYLRLRPERGSQGVIDGLIATIAVASLAWVGYLGSHAEAAAGGVLGTLVAALYPALDLLCMAALAWIVVRAGRRSPVWVRWLVAAFAWQAVAGAAYLATVLPGHSPDTVAVVAFMCAGWCWVAAGLERLRAPQRAWAEGTHDRPPVWSEPMPFLLGIGVVGLAGLDPGPELRAAAVAVTGLMAVRAMAALRVGRQLVTERDRLLVTDPLTGAYNRRFLADESGRALARAERGDEPLSVIAIDLDRFKEVNDRFGHERGDRLLQEVSRAVAGQLRAGDILCRLGGDEFLILCPAAGAEGAVVVAERVRLRILEAAAQVVPEVPVSASLGIATYPADADGADALMRGADTALYLAKSRGRNAVASFAEVLAGEPATAR